MEFAEEMPVIAGMAVDWSGRLWLERTGPRVGEEGPIDIVSPGGIVPRHPCSGRASTPRRLRARRPGRLHREGRYGRAQGGGPKVDSTLTSEGTHERRLTIEVLRHQGLHSPSSIGGSISPLGFPFERANPENSGLPCRPGAITPDVDRCHLLGKCDRAQCGGERRCSPLRLGSSQFGPSSAT